MHEDFTVNSRLSCGSDAYPTAHYEWNIIRGSGFVDGEVFVIDSPGFFNVSCTADNFLNLPDPNVECSKTVFATGYVPSHTYLYMHMYTYIHMRMCPADASRRPQFMQFCLNLATVVLYQKPQFLQWLNAHFVVVLLT